MVEVVRRPLQESAPFSVAFALEPGRIRPTDFCFSWDSRLSVRTARVFRTPRVSDELLKAQTWGRPYHRCCDRSAGVRECGRGRARQ